MSATADIISFNPRSQDRRRDEAERVRVGLSEGCTPKQIARLINVTERHVTEIVSALRLTGQLP